jgi:hypothetical protein
MLLAAGAALALGHPDLRATGLQSYLAVLLQRRDELEQRVADYAALAQLRRSPDTPPLRKQLRASRRAEAQAAQALERLEWVIADTPAESLDDVALKIRFCGELQGFGAQPAHWRAPLTIEEQLLRTIMADLKRLSEPGLAAAIDFVLQKAPSVATGLFYVARRLLKADTRPFAIAIDEYQSRFLKGAAELGERAAVGIGAVLVAGDRVGRDPGALGSLDDIPAQRGPCHAQLFAGDHGMFPLSL